MPVWIIVRPPKLSYSIFIVWASKLFREIWNRISTIYWVSDRISLSIRHERWQQFEWISILNQRNVGADWNLLRGPLYSPYIKPQHWSSSDWRSAHKWILSKSGNDCIEVSNLRVKNQNNFWSIKCIGPYLSGTLQPLVRSGLWHFGSMLMLSSLPP